MTDNINLIMSSVLKRAPSPIPESHRNMNETADLKKSKKKVLSYMKETSKGKG